MDDDPLTTADAFAPPSPSEQPEPDIMNDPAFAPNVTTTRRNTMSSDNGSEKIDTCRICRSEGTPDEPLFYPCKCSGSIKFVHQECLMEWLSHSHKKHCELCKTQFRFTKLYDANMPTKLPWAVFVRRACWHVVQMLGKAGRGLLVGFVWSALIPWLIRWVWRWFFWIADAAWAREAFMEAMRSESEQVHGQQGNVEWLANGFSRLFDLDSLFNETDGPLAYSIVNALAKNFNLASDNTTSTGASFTWPQADPSILSSWSYIATLTPSPRANRLILDVFEGQLITCVVITAFILVFLIREWVVQQQPLVNLENLGNVQAQLRDAADRVQAENERLRRQQALLEQARRRLAELQDETEELSVSAAASAGDSVVSTKMGFVGWEGLEQVIDEATAHLRKGGESEHALFLSCATIVTKQIRAAGRADVNLDEFTEKVFAKLATFSDHERREWQAVLVSEIQEVANAKLRLLGTPIPEQDTAEAKSPSDSAARLPMAKCESSDWDAQTQRLQEEAGGNADGASNGTHAGTATRSTIQEAFGSSSSSSSWQQITPPDDSNAEHFENSAADLEPVPITNAGPDAKINIKRSGKRKMRPVPEPKIEEKMLTDDELKERLEEEVTKEMSEELKSGNKFNESTSSRHDENSRPSSEHNPFHPDGPEPERRESESFGNRVASVFREEFGLDEAEELENLRRAGLGPDGEPAVNEGHVAERPPRLVDDGPPTFAQRLIDWFWGDIQVEGAREPIITPNEERVQERDESQDAVQEALLVPAQDEQPATALVDAPPPPAPEADPIHHDPEVIAAAQQAGLDAEAMEDAEDLEGIFELIGLQGPLIGLFQTSAFCTLLVSCTIIGAVIMPYACGKVMLILIGSPVYFLVKMPLLIAGFLADFVLDLILMLSGWVVWGLALLADLTLMAAQKWLPRLGGLKLVNEISKYAFATAMSSGVRLAELFSVSKGPEDVNWSWAFLGSSVHAHASLREIEDEINSLLSYAGAAVTWSVEIISSGSITAVCKRSLYAALHVWELPTRASVQHLLWQYTEPVLDFLASLSKGALTFSTPDIRLDPSLVYWNSSDRALAILTGYIALAALAAVYVAMDRPITRSESGRRTEKMIRDTFRQAGGVLKVILIISIEMLVFPLYCGLLLDLAFLPLFQTASVASRWAFAGRKPYTFCFVHWFVGTCYMFHFALFVGMCRKILRKGVLWFIRDPDDPTFHPVRDVLERNVTTQLRKIAFSALVYGALVILCLGGVIWTIGQVFQGIFPIHWISTEPVLEFPMDLLLYNAVTPLVIRLFKPSDAVNAMYAWWLRRCARVLRLSHFLFGDRRKDEEGHTVRKSWPSFLLMKTADVESGSLRVDEPEYDAQVYFIRDGKYVLTPCNDQYRPPKPGEAFLHVDDNDVYIANKDGKKNDHFAKVYVPPMFKLRITLFMMCLWMFSAFMGLCATLVPLVFGRQLFASFVPAGIRVNDIYAYSVGAYSLGGTLFVALKGRAGAMFIKEKAIKVDVKAWIEPTKRFAVKTLKCLYVYGFLGIVLPITFALLLQFYLILPLHTWAVSAAALEAPLAQNANATDATFTFFANATDSQNLPTLADHTIHILQDFALGMMYARIATRLVLAAPASRAAEAFRRITADGYLNPNVWLATRFFVLPVSLIAAFVLLVPPLVINLAITAIQIAIPHALLDAEAEVKLYRYSYPLAAGCVMIALAAMELGRATSRWRARIKDEVYLVGERLHNFGEKRPPAWSKSVVRKEK